MRGVGSMVPPLFGWPMRGRPSKPLGVLVRDGSFRARRHSALLEGPLVSAEGPREIQVAYRGADSESERRRLALEFEKAAARLCRRRFVKSPLEAIRAMEFAEFAASYLVHPKGQRAGEPFVLEGWQAEFDRERSRRDTQGRLVYGTMFLGLPRGNGKTCLAAGVALHELLRRPNAPSVFFAASSKRQAEIAFGYVKGFIRGSRELSALLDISKRHGCLPGDRWEMEVLPAQGATAYGLSPDVAIRRRGGTSGRRMRSSSFWATLRDRRAEGGRRVRARDHRRRPGSSDSLLAGLLEHELGEAVVERPHDALQVVRDEDRGVVAWWYGVGEARRTSTIRSSGSVRTRRALSRSAICGRQRLAPGIDDATFSKLHLNRPGADSADALIAYATWNACRSSWGSPSAARSSRPRRATMRAGLLRLSGLAVPATAVSSRWRLGRGRGRACRL